VIAIHFAEDIPGKNVLGPVLKDEELFASSLVTCVGQPIGIVTALTRAQALLAARAVKISYEDLESILTIEEAIEKNSFYDLVEKQISRGNVDQGLQGDEIVCISGTVRMGGQEHFYLEPNAHIVDPMESGEIISHSSTQCPQKHQQYISNCLGIPAHKVVVKTKRAGGGFGGKETRAAFVNTAAAIPAYLLGRPVSLVLDRDTDMSITGHRHPFMAFYKAACDQNGKLVAVDVVVYNNAGNSLDLSASVMDRALLSLDSVYNIPNYRVKGFVCRTNLPSNTAFRGFGAPQGMMIMESIMDKFSKTTGIDRNILTEINMYSEGDSTPYGQVLRGCQARQCWDEALRSAGGLTERQEAIDSFNSSHKYRKRGLAVIPTKFGISFTLKFLNQAGALVHIYQSDGSVLVSHGGVEMGQGLHTKVCQIVAHELGVPIEKVHISETSTDKVPNATPTAASASSDLYGAAAAIACAEINNRLKPYREMFPDASFTDIVQKAYFDRVDLSAHGFYKTPDITDFPGGNMPFNYFTYGTAVTEVEMDILTGDWHIIRSDVVMDVGQSLNPAIDIGQVEGAFVQGMGWSCLEELVWGDNQHQWIAKTGSLFSCGPGTYKIPTANDIPIDFRVTLLRNSPCERTPLVHSSKAVGEPPFFLGTSVFWALKNAIYASREDSDMHGWFNLDLPCTPERLRMSCEDFVKNNASTGNGEIPKLSC
jgi:xanthine dehydrogenase/oxidase